MLSDYSSIRLNERLHLIPEKLCTHINPKLLPLHAMLYKHDIPLVIGLIYIFSLIQSWIKIYQITKLSHEEVRVKILEHITFWHTVVLYSQLTPEKNPFIKKCLQNYRLISKSPFIMFSTNCYWYLNVCNLFQFIFTSF